MKIRFNSSFNSATIGNIVKGDERELHQARAQLFIEAGVAEEIKTVKAEKVKSDGDNNTKRSKRTPKGRS